MGLAFFKAPSPGAVLLFPLKVFPGCAAWILLAVVVGRHRVFSA